MPDALVLIIVDSRIEKHVKEEIQSYPGVEEVHYIYGPYDMYVKIQCDTMQCIHNLVLDKIRTLYGIVTTVTCLIPE